MGTQKSMEKSNKSIITKIRLAYLCKFQANSFQKNIIKNK